MGISRWEFSQGKRFVLKVIEKLGVGEATLLPAHCVHMVQLHGFCETDVFLVLLLEFAPNGRLFHFLVSAVECVQSLGVLLRRLLHQVVGHSTGGAPRAA